MGRWNFGSFCNTRILFIKLILISTSEIQRAHKVSLFLVTLLTSGIWCWLIATCKLSAKSFRENHMLSQFNKAHRSRISSTMRKSIDYIDFDARLFYSLQNFSILQLLNQRYLEKLKEKWWKKDDVSAKCEKTEDQSDGISIQNIGGVFIVIFVGIGMACVTLIFEYWYYKIRKVGNRIFGDESEFPMQKSIKHQQTIKNMTQFGSNSGLIDPTSNNTLKSRYPAAGNFRARF